MICDIRSLLRAELLAQFEKWGQPAYRVEQLLHWLYRRRAQDWEAMTNLPKTLRAQLREHYTLHGLELARLQGHADSTRKFLWRLSDGAFIESVLIPANPALYGEPSDRHTLCVSTQVGCAYGCKFCASGLEGWKRNLQAEEIVGQVLAVEQHAPASSGFRVPSSELGQGAEPIQGESEHPTRNSEPETRNAEPGTRNPSPGRLIDNLVIMGMGEPLANYTNLLRALRILNAPWGAGIGARKITVSTSGLAPQIRQLADEPEQFGLALSLHGATDAVRDRLMPVNRKYPLRELVAACEYYHSKKGRMITLEYILIAGVNDAIEHARPLASLARRLHAKVNLIPYNRVEGLPWERPSEGTQSAFLAALERQRISVTLRREKGHDIDAACGQLRLKTAREIAAVAAAQSIELPRAPS